MSRKKKKEEEKKQKEDLKKTKPTKKELKEKRNAQNAIHYSMMIKNGICVLPNGLYSAGIRFKDINYQIATDEQQTTIFGKYMDILNSLGQEYGIQLLVNNRKIDEEDYEDDVMFKLAGDHLDKHRLEMNSMLKEKIATGNNKIVSDKMMLFTIKEDSYEDAVKSLHLLDGEFRNKFSDLGCEPETMKGHDRLETINYILNPDGKLFFNYDKCDGSFTSKDAITPDSFDFVSEGSGAFRINDRYAKVMYLKNWSTELNDQLIQSLTRLEYNLTISFHMKAISRGDDLSLVKKQIAKMEMQKMTEQKKALKDGYDPDMLSMDLKYSLEEAALLKDDVEKRNQRLFDCQFLIMLNSATKEELKETQKAVETACKKLACELGTLSYRQEDGMNAVLPLGTSIKNLSRTLPTATCGVVMPFTSQELMQKDLSVFYGVNTITNNVIMANRTSLPNPLGWVLGQPGFGKSFAVKLELSQILFKTNDEVICIDPQGEFVPLADDYKGSSINVDTKSGVHFNPFDGDISEKNFIKNKGEFAQVMMAEIIGEGKLDAEQKSLVDICARKMYEEYQAKKLEEKTNGIRVDMPSLDDFCRIMKSRSEQKAKDMVLSLQMYISGGTYDLFSGQNNIDMNNRFTVFNILELPETIRPLSMKIVLETLRTKILSNFKKGIKTWVYIDEIYLLLKDEYSENFLYEFFKWARKFGAIPTGLTQNVSDLLNSPKAQTMLSNSLFILMLNQSSSDCDELATLLHLSREQMSCVSNAKKGSGLIKFGNTIIPFTNEFPKDLPLYDLWNTDFDEINQNKKTEIL